VEDHNGRLVRKEMKAKSYPPRNSDKKKAVPRFNNSRRIPLR
jgi:hypothetical protein